MVSGGFKFYNLPVEQKWNGFQWMDQVDPPVICQEPCCCSCRSSRRPQAPEAPAAPTPELDVLLASVAFWKRCCRRRQLEIAAWFPKCSWQSSDCQLIGDEMIGDDYQ